MTAGRTGVAPLGNRRKRPEEVWPQHVFARTSGAGNGESLVSHAEDHDDTRRDFLYYATAGAGAVTVGAAVWPLVNQMNPSDDVQALSSIRVDISVVDPGTQITVLWQGKPVFIRSRTEEEIAAAAEAFIVQYERIETPDSLAEYTMDHTSLLYLMDENWELKTFFAEADASPKYVADCLVQHIG